MDTCGLIMIAGNLLAGYYAFQTEFSSSLTTPCLSCVRKEATGDYHRRKIQGWRSRTEAGIWMLNRAIK